MKPFKQLPAVDELRRAFYYDRNSGELSWIKKNTLIKAGYRAHDGYILVGFGGPGKLWVAHRLIWKIVTGDDPGQLEVDHINRIRDDNKWENLRLVDRYVQMHNRSVFAKSRTGLKGAYIHKGKSAKDKPFKSSIMRHGKHVFLGYYNTAEEAHAAYVAAGGLP
jgi:hypothetical protein